MDKLYILTAVYRGNKFGFVQNIVARKMLLQGFFASAGPHRVHTKVCYRKSVVHYSYHLKLNDNIYIYIYINIYIIYIYIYILLKKSKFKNCSLQ